MEAGGLARAGGISKRAWTAHVPSLHKTAAEALAGSLRDLETVAGGGGV